MLAPVTHHSDTSRPLVHNYRVPIRAVKLNCSRRAKHPRSAAACLTPAQHKPATSLVSCQRKNNDDKSGTLPCAGGSTASRYEAFELNRMMEPVNNVSAVSLGPSVGKGGESFSFQQPPAPELQEPGVYPESSSLLLRKDR